MRHVGDASVINNTRTTWQNGASGPVVTKATRRQGSGERRVGRDSMDTTGEGMQGTEGRRGGLFLQ
jgi:hypothetical protein